MRRTWTTDLAGLDDGEPVRLEGWLHHQRRLANVTFLLVRDGRGIAQVVLEDEEQRTTTGDLPPETVVRIDGRAVHAPQAPGGVEVHEPRLDVLVTPVEAPPFELRRPELPASLPTLLDAAAASLRHPTRRDLLRVSASSVRGFRRTLDDLGFVEVHTPKIVGAATEGGANVFRLDYFGRPGYLAQSPQLYKQLLVGVFERVYETGPVFRAEPHDTGRHLAQYTSLDVELGFIEDHRDVMAVLREVLAGMVEEVVALGVLGEVPTVPAAIPVVHFDDAQRMLENALDERVVGEPDLAPAHERWLGEWARAEHGSDFVFVEGYPMAKRPFYTHPDPTRPGSSNSFDLLFRGLELVTGGQRLHRFEDYAAVLDADTQEALRGYLDGFRYGMPPHGGFAIGLERWTSRLAGLTNIREATAFPRDRMRLSP
jgi:nondiscriminating aspartyl-tRNA synthetase